MSVAAPEDSGERDERLGQESVYELFRMGMKLLEGKNHAQAIISLEKARSLEPEKSSIREALGRAYFHTGKYEEAASEFRYVIDGHPLNDYAQFCLGRALQKLGRTKQARHHLSLAARMRPDRDDYRAYRDELEKA